MADDEIEQFEEQARVEVTASDQLRRTVADVYTFVRSAEINKTISGFTLDHYIDEAKRRIRDTRVLRSASDPGRGVGTRPSQLAALETLEEDFARAFEEAQRVAAQAPEES